MLRRLRVPGLMTGCLVAVLLATTAGLGHAVTVAEVTGAVASAAAIEPNGEIHSSFGDAPDEMWLYWRGPDSVVSFGPDLGYGSTAQAVAPTATPVDTSGPFWQVELTGLTPNTTYHYAIGNSGVDHTFRSAPTGDFVWDDIGDTGTTYRGGCNTPWMSQVWQQIAAEQPALVTHGGDISYANSCGKPAVHQFWEDIAPVATQAAMQFAWGNHEAGSSQADSLGNYKGRFNMPHAQTVPSDTPTTVSGVGCPSPADPTKNGCRGDDWGYFTAGHVLFVAYPEPWTGAYPDWLSKVDPLMAQAEADPNIFMIVTYGHRPAYGNGGGGDLDLRAAIDTLGDKYSPAARPDGKYLLNVAHHVHSGQALTARHGVVHLVDGAGGTDIVTTASAAAGTLFISGHFSHLRTTFSGDRLTYSFICGPDSSPASGNTCTAGSVMFSQTLTGYDGSGGPPPPPPPTTKDYITNPSFETDKVGWTGLYNAQSKTVRTLVDKRDGQYSLKIVRNVNTVGPAGVVSKPSWVATTTAAAHFDAGVWVRGQKVGQSQAVVLQIDEVNPAGTIVGTKSTTLTFSDVAWHQLTVPYTTVGANNHLDFVVYSPTLKANAWFLADLASLVGPS